MKANIRRAALISALAAFCVALYVSPCAAHSHETKHTEDEHRDAIAAQHLIDRHFEIWNDTNPDRRAPKFPLVYSKTFFVADESGVASGYQAVGRLVGQLQSSHEGFVFTPDPVELNHGLCRVTWGYGPRDNPNQIRGEDIFTIEHGKLTSARVFINHQ